MNAPEAAPFPLLSPRRRHRLLDQPSADLWSARMSCKILCLVALTLASIVPSATLAQSRQRHAHPNEFYARALDEVETISLPQKETHRGDCFRSLTPVEMNRGIRHWTGNC